jgi:hypothetical protein
MLWVQFYCLSLLGYVLAKLFCLMDKRFWAFSANHFYVKDKKKLLPMVGGELTPQVKPKIFCR